PRPARDETGRNNNEMICLFALPLPQLLRVTLLGVLPFNPSNRNLTRLLDRDGLPFAVPELLQDVKAARVTKGAQRLGRLMATHGILVQVGEDIGEGRHR